ncbi:hypothetical protein Ppa06_58480 [Planomonospora parontospora subsp. parontospora]|uniref:Uncharacterized protein n=2 Tax=Planomonospora parontospora TaxID=58119 RepID=A0AA37BM36_9ACTN|nr:hypothetical protein [Planomonospora parontospora]GGK91126.1 hypothetical protein GCM10010126_58180 [Planomonospora parontospora]GII12050.1 hypothetical protein Ppa06_58480 [Planomonospora parontospora subsp. parontospora]
MELPEEPPPWLHERVMEALRPVLAKRRREIADLKRMWGDDPPTFGHAEAAPPASEEASRTADDQE